MKKIISAVLAVFMIAALLPSAFAAEGNTAIVEASMIDGDVYYGK